MCRNTFLCVLDEEELHVRSKATARSKSLGAIPKGAVLGQQPDQTSTTVGDQELMPLPARASERVAIDCQSGSPTNHSMEDRTTVMIRNVPYKYTVDELSAEIEESGFQGMFDLVYLPMLAKCLGSRGYAFVNFISSAAAGDFQCRFSKHRFNQHQEQFRKPASVSYAQKQGFSPYSHMFLEGRAGAKPGLLIRRSQPDM